MLTRVYIDNFRCFVNFEWCPGRKQLILGGNGSGKSSLLDVLLRLRQVAFQGGFIDDLYSLGQHTRWLNQQLQTFEIEARLAHGNYVYRLVIEPDQSELRPRVVSESVRLDGKAIFEFEGGQVRLYNDDLAHKVTYPFDSYRSALATITSMPDNQKLTDFKLWFAGFQFFRINPFAMDPRATGDRHEPNLDLSNFATWYWYLRKTAGEKAQTAFTDHLAAAFDGFERFDFDPVAETVRLLLAEFTDAKGTTARYSFNELSEGQRCLICLYAILDFILAKGRTVILDEPENFISLREIQPWLMEVTDAVDDGNGQVLLISHHPEIMNQWAPDFGVHFVREGTGSVRVQEFNSGAESGLTPAELVARGWELG